MAAAGQRKLRSSTANMEAQLQKGASPLSNTGPGSGKQHLTAQAEARGTLCPGQKLTEEQCRDPLTMPSDARGEAAAAISKPGLNLTEQVEARDLTEQAEARGTLSSGQKLTDEGGRDPLTMASDAWGEAAAAIKLMRGALESKPVLKQLEVLQEMKAAEEAAEMQEEIQEMLHTAKACAAGEAGDSGK
jgi:hypothetical protein